MINHEQTLRSGLDMPAPVGKKWLNPASDRITNIEIMSLMQDPLARSCSSFNRYVLHGSEAQVLFDTTAHQGQSFRKMLKTA